ncbi:MAG: radical SAM protein [Ruminococcaceae bacterium]|nr:radical SAM protein [Oscillospiraceae bacterium]
MNEKLYKKCELCSRKCGVDRSGGELGFCKMSDTVYIARADLHMWEEPPITAKRGSGTVFFSGCSLGCIYCQNRKISRGKCGSPKTVAELSEIFLALEKKGAHNINLVTPTHYVPSIISAVSLSREKGLRIPIVYNTGSYETEETIELLRETVDVWLPDLKYYKPKTAKEYSSAENLPEVSRRAIAKMVKIAGEPVIDGEGVMQRGVIVRILLLPGHVAEAKLNLKYLYETYGDKIYISLMSQYTPSPDLPSPLNRRVSVAEYDELVSYAEKLGITRAFTQEREAASESFIPDFEH